MLRKLLQVRPQLRMLLGLDYSFRFRISHHLLHPFTRSRLPSGVLRDPVLKHQSERSRRSSKPQFDVSGEAKASAALLEVEERKLPPPFGDGDAPEEPPAPEPEPEPEEEDDRNKNPGTQDGRKRKTTALTLSILLGPIGADRFYLGHTKLAALKLLTVGGLGIWWITDIVLIATDQLPDRMGNELVK